MADDVKTSYPYIPIKQWWGLREKFKSSLPKIVTPSYLATALSISERSGRDLMLALKTLGIIDNEGKTLERANAWRDDDAYPQVCAEMLHEVYPEELLHAVPDPMQERAAAERWFATTAKAGEKTAKKYATVYELLREADPSQAREAGKAATSRAAKVRSSTGGRRAQRAAGKATSGNRVMVSGQQEIGNGGASPVQRQPVLTPQLTQLQPAIHIDVQIHISSDASADQIDQIFASMAKHLRRLGEL